jgi:hypothetical protein
MKNGIFASLMVAVISTQPLAYAQTRPRGPNYNPPTRGDDRLPSRNEDRPTPAPSRPEPTPSRPAPSRLEPTPTPSRPEPTPSRTAPSRPDPTPTPTPSRPEPTPSRPTPSRPEHTPSRPTPSRPEHTPSRPTPSRPEHTPSRRTPSRPEHTPSRPAPTYPTQSWPESRPTPSPSYEPSYEDSYNSSYDESSYEVSSYEEESYEAPENMNSYDMKFSKITRKKGGELLKISSNEPFDFEQIVFEVEKGALKYLEIYFLDESGEKIEVSGVDPDYINNLEDPSFIIENYPRVSIKAIYIQAESMGEEANINVHVSAYEEIALKKNR